MFQPGTAGTLAAAASFAPGETARRPAAPYANRNAHWANRHRHDACDGAAMIGEDTCHPATRAMLAYARALARGVETPPLGPDGAGAADRLFVIQRRSDDSLVALGEGLDAVFVRGALDVETGIGDLGRLFAPPERRLLLALLDACVMAGEPGVIRAEGETYVGETVALEIMVSPLPNGWSRGDRFLGHVVTLTDNAGLIAGRLSVGPILTPLARSRPKAQPALRLVVSNP